ncbi:MAG TPA: metal-dependent hydrolase [Chitinophagaceae bacterium]
MDSLTHIALGACIGDAIAGKKLGKKAMIWGAVANSIPDFDVIASFWLTMDRNLLAHRGFTHSLMFMVLITPLLSLLAFHWHRSKGIRYLAWIVFFSIQLLSHMFIDVFNNYGVGLLEPFSNGRFSFNTIYVFDLFFSLPLILAATVLVIMRTSSSRRKFWWRFGIIAPAFYLVYCSYNKFIVDREIRSLMKAESIPYKHYFTTPTPLNSWLWFVVSDADSGLYTGYRSVFDRSDTMHFTWFAKNDSLLSTVATDEELRSLNNLKRFSQGFYTVQKWHDTLVFNDLRFGQIVGWHDPNEKFVFHYFIQHKDNAMAVQRGRFARWNRETFRTLIRRIKGN